MLHDFKYAVRLLRTRPGFAVMVILVLALGIGINTAFFSVVNEVLLRPIPWKDPDRIVSVWETSKANNSNLVSAANFVEWREKTSSEHARPSNRQIFERVAGWRFLYLNLTGRDEPERVQGLTVSPDYFPLLNVNAEIGRTFVPEEEEPGQDKVIVLSHRLWERRFAADPSIVGQPITVEGEPYTVVGVLPSDFHIFRVLNRDLDVFIPLRLDRAELARTDTPQSKPSSDSEQVMFVYGRLKVDLSIEQAQGSMTAIYSGLEQEFPNSNAGTGVRLVRLQEQWTTQLRPTLLMLLVSIGCVLMISCANAANLLLARASVREKEMAVRAALGASRMRVIGQLLTESLVLAVLGGVIGLVLAFWGIKLLNGLIPYSVLNRADEFRVDASVVGFTLIISLATGIAFGLAPALQMSRIDLSSSLKELGGSAGSRLRGAKLRSALIVTEIALAVTLLIGAGLMIRSVISLQNGNRGLNTGNILTMQIFLPGAKYQSGNEVSRFYRQVLQKVESIPGVESASLINYPPLGVISTTVPFEVPGRESPSPDDTLVAQYSVVSSEYFRTTGIHLLSGREFTNQDRDERHGVVIISANMAQRIWPNGDSVGKRIIPRFPAMRVYWLPESNSVPLEVIGVVGDVKRDGIAETTPNQPRPEIYLPYLQNPSSIMHLMVRTPTDPLRWTSSIRGAVSAVDKDQPVSDIKTLDEVVAESFARPRILTLVLVAFAGFALSLAAAGIYGVVSYSVAQRTHEIGIRVALGAQRAYILRLIIRQMMSLTAAGLVVGFVIGIVGTRMIASLFYGVSATDPITFGLVAVLLGGVAFVASYIPARKAMSVDPMVALRCQ